MFAVQRFANGPENPRHRLCEGRRFSEGTSRVILCGQVAFCPLTVLNQMLESAGLFLDRAFLDEQQLFQHRDLRPQTSYFVAVTVVHRHVLLNVRRPSKGTSASLRFIAALRNMSAVARD